MNEDFIDEELIQEFFTDVEESFYPQVAEAVERIKADDVDTAVEMMMRPLHTIKGASAFLNMQNVAALSHKVEDYLKAVQTGSVPREQDFLVQSVDMVFNYLESIKNGESPDEDGRRRILDGIMHRMGSPKKAADKEPVSIEKRDGLTLIHIRIPRVHLPSHYKMLVETLDGLDRDSEVLLDMTGVRTLNSTAWGAIRASVDRLRVAVAGLQSACRATFYAWKFDDYISVFESEDEYLRQREQGVLA